MTTEGTVVVASDSQVSAVFCFMGNVNDVHLVVQITCNHVTAYYAALAAGKKRGAMIRMRVKKCA